ncbi:MAG TPA: type II toxin-antitoxin system VapC family toxin [Mycobacteriales bacterium]|nr:type II toxin-antitoxin system VapC family toxin [Mycobacteriales bacterium]
MSYLLDTNVVSELRRPRPNKVVLGWFDSVGSADLWLSVLVLGEIRQGIEQLARRDADQAATYEKWLLELADLFGDRVVPVTAEVVDLWGRLNVPDRLPAVDGLLAATALVHGWTLVTRNTADVVRTGVRLVNPFEGS